MTIIVLFKADNLIIATSVFLLSKVNCNQLKGQFGQMDMRWQNGSFCANAGVKQHREN